MSTGLQHHAGLHWTMPATAALLTVATVVLAWSTWRHTRIVKRTTDRVVTAVATQRMSQLADLVEEKDVARWPEDQHR
jgi:hypothetical protein